MSSHDGGGFYRPKCGHKLFFSYPSGMSQLALQDSATAGSLSVLCKRKGVTACLQ